ncbi:hypothetical protein SPAR52_1728 [Streptococcus pneumoniae GA17971]|nr:hypothetical protein SPAR52_1728 [Streptococcus pneumoniae GA17971]
MRLEIINGQKIYGKRPILNQLNLVFQSGKIYGLKGDNGSGKTVLLKILAGYIKLDKGKVLQDGKVYGIKNHYIQDAGILIEKVEFLSHLSLRENLELLRYFSSKVTEKELPIGFNTMIYRNLKMLNTVIYPWEQSKKWP